jgi:pimeloyl-ACP methyl ester carboxylesterase
MIALMGALKVEKATIAGGDWGARTADVMAAVWLERCNAVVSVSETIHVDGGPSAGH